MAKSMLRVLIPGGILLMGGLALVVPSPATVAISKKEKAACTVCHVKAGSKELNKVGECYKSKGSLDACKTDQTK